MASFDFPNNPNVGDTFNDPVTGATFRWNGYGWDGGAGGGTGAIIVAPTPPPTPPDSALWWESDTGYMYIRYNDGNSAQWVQVNAVPNLANYVAKSGDTMTGNLAIAPVGITASLTLNKPVGSFANNLTGRVNGLARWVAQLGTGNAESTGNAGSDFAITRYDDSGAYIDAPFSISRASALATFSASLGAVGNITSQASVFAGQNFISSTANVVLSTTGAGTVFLRPNGAGSGAGQVQIGSNGLATFPSTASFANNAAFYLGDNGAENVLSMASGYFLAYNRSTALLRWVTQGNTIQAMTLDQSGRMTCNAGYYCKGGMNGAIGANIFNFMYNAGTMAVWADATNMGNMTIASDYRIKKDITPLGTMWETVKKLNPISYTHKEYTPPTAMEKDGGKPDPMVLDDDIERWGFVAHELQETLIEDAATGFKDSPEHIQSPNPWTVIATLTKALQEAMARIEALEARIV